MVNNYINLAKEVCVQHFNAVAPQPPPPKKEKKPTFENVQFSCVPFVWS